MEVKDATREEIIEYFLDPATGEPLKGLFLNSKSDHFLRRMAELSGQCFVEWLTQKHNHTPGETE